MSFLCEMNAGRLGLGRRQRGQREIYIAEWGEKERTVMRREKGVGF
jgi:hypothetical protein